MTAELMLRQAKLSSHCKRFCDLWVCCAIKTSIASQNLSREPQIVTRKCLQREHKTHKLNTQASVQDIHACMQVHPKIFGTVPHQIIEKGTVNLMLFIPIPRLGLSKGLPPI